MPRPQLTLYAALTLVVTVMALVGPGCGRHEDASIAGFEQQWRRALRDQDHERLFHMLDARSRRRITRDLETLRGLEADKQRRVIEQLGGINVTSLNQINAAQYFALFWRRKTNLKRPDTLFDVPEGAQAGTMVLTLDGREEKFTVLLEGDRWVWKLPEPSQFTPNESPEPPM